MTFLPFIEFIAMSLSMIGAWYSIGTDHEKHPTAKGLGFLFFALSNFSMMLFAFYADLYALLIQMMIFNIGTLIAVYKFSNKKRVPYVFILAFISWSFILYNLYKINGIPFSTMSTFEIVAAIIAIIGVYTYLSEEILFKNIAFACYFIADIMYVSIAYEQQHLFFGILSAFFVFTSIRGFYYVNFVKKEEILSKI